MVKLKKTEISQFNGGNGIVKSEMYNDTHIKFMKTILEKDCSIGLHQHLTSSEVIYVIKGQAKCILNNVEEIVNEGGCHYCPKGSFHSIQNVQDEPLLIFCVVPQQ